MAVSLSFALLPLQNTWGQATNWLTLPDGQHSVGYQVFNKYDYGRNVRPRTNFEGKKIEGERAVPIQLSMWYPAEASSDEKMQLKAYVYLTLEKNDFIPLTDEQKSKSVDVLKFPAKFGPGIELSDEQIRSAYGQPMKAVRDARMKNGSFPVIVVASDGGPSNNAALFEHLASIGYIVFFTPGISRDGTRQVNAPQRVLADRINNIEYVLSFARTIPSADLGRLGVIGVNFDGMTALLYQMKSGNASAVVSIDGWEGKVGTEATLKESIYYDPVNFTVPYFVVLQDEKDPQPWLTPSQGILNALLYADRYYYVFKDMSHAYLVADLYSLPMIPDANRKAYVYLYTSIAKYFDAYVKGDAAAKSFINNVASDNGLPPGIVKTELKSAGLAPVPSAEELEMMIMAGEFDKVTQIAKNAVRTNPSLKLIDASALDLYNFRFTQRSQPESALKVRQLGIVTYPLSAQAWSALGDAQLNVNQKEEAAKSYRKALELIDADHDLDPKRKHQLRLALKKLLDQ
jgi:tetratricopeptide (TPR) repeat protein